MRQPSPRTYLLTSGAIAGAVFGTDLVRLLRGRQFPAGEEFRSAALAAAAVLAAVGLSGRQTRDTLDLARRLERVRSATLADRTVVRTPTVVRSG